MERLLRPLGFLLIWLGLRTGFLSPRVCCFLFKIRRNFNWFQVSTSGAVKKVLGGWQLEFGGVTVWD